MIWYAKKTTTSELLTSMFVSITSNYTHSKLHSQCHCWILHLSTDFTLSTSKNKKSVSFIFCSHHARLINVVCSHVTCNKLVAATVGVDFEHRAAFRPIQNWMNVKAQDVTLPQQCIDAIVCMKVKRYREHCLNAICCCVSSWRSLRYRRPPYRFPHTLSASPSLCRLHSSLCFTMFHNLYFSHLSSSTCARPSHLISLSDLALTTNLCPAPYIRMGVGGLSDFQIPSASISQDSITACWLGWQWHPKVPLPLDVCLLCFSRISYSSAHCSARCYCRLSIVEQYLSCVIEDGYPSRVLSRAELYDHRQSRDARRKY